MVTWASTVHHPRRVTCTLTPRLVLHKHVSKKFMRPSGSLKIYTESSFKKVFKKAPQAMGDFVMSEEMVVEPGQRPVTVWKVWHGDSDVWEITTIEEWELVMETTLVSKLQVGPAHLIDVFDRTRLALTSPNNSNNYLTAMDVSDEISRMEAARGIRAFTFLSFVFG